MKTVIWVSCLVQCKYQQLLKLSFKYVVHVHVKNAKIFEQYKNGNCVLPPSSSL